MSKKEFAASRRQLLQAAGGVAAAALLPKPLRAGVHVQGSDEIRVALVGCGGRGSGAAVNAVSVQRGPVKLVAMADVFEDRLNDSYKNLSGSSHRKWTFHRSGGSWASTPTSARWTPCGRGTW